jgi:MYXO-CTERM domain-containing protein
MRLAPFASSLAVATLILASARADLGPPPKCDKGQHHEYLYGHRCVPDGSHAEKDPSGGVRFVPDGTPAASSSAAVQPASTTTVPPVPPAPPPTSAPAPSASAAPAPTATKSKCSFSGGEGDGAALVVMIGALFAMRRRRR